MLYSKNGSNPVPFPDNNEDGWDEVINKPEAPDGKEVVWWFPPGWVIRTPKPVEIPNAVWKWEQMTGRWVSYNKDGRLSHVDAIDPNEQVKTIIKSANDVSVENTSITSIIVLETSQITVI